MEVWKWAGRAQGRRKRRQELWLCHLLFCADHWPEAGVSASFCQKLPGSGHNVKDFWAQLATCGGFKDQSSFKSSAGGNLCHVLVRTSPKAAYPFPRVCLFNFFTSTHAHKHTHSRAHAHTHTHFSQHSCLWHLISRDNEQAALI